MNAACHPMLTQHIATWIHFFRKHFHIHFIHRKLVHFNFHFTEDCSEGYNGQWLIIGSGNDLALNRRQAITWTNNDPSSVTPYCITKPQWVNSPWTKGDNYIAGHEFKSIHPFILWCLYAPLGVSGVQLVKITFCSTCHIACQKTQIMCHLN